MAGVRAGDLVWRNTWRILYYLLVQSTREHIEGAFFYILENFEEFLLISGRENALRVTRNVDIPCRNLLTIIQPSPLKTGELPFSVRSAKYYFKIRCSNGCFFWIMRSKLFYMFAHKNGSFRFVKLTTFVTVVFLNCHWTWPHLKF